MTVTVASFGASKYIHGVGCFLCGERKEGEGGRQAAVGEGERRRRARVEEGALGWLKKERRHSPGHQINCGVDVDMVDLLPYRRKKARAWWAWAASVRLAKWKQARWPRLSCFGHLSN